MSYIHNIPVHLYDNPLTESENDLFARIETNKSLNIRDICSSVVERTHAPVDIDMMEMCVHKFLEEMLYRGCDGYAVNAEYFSMALHIKGVFNGVTDHYDPQRHKIVAEFQEGNLTRKYIDQNTTLTIKGKADATTHITQIKDSVSGSIDSNITPGGAIIITGNRIKLVGDNPDVGAYLEQLSDGATQKIAATQIVENNPSKLIILLPPSLIAGTQVRLAIKTQFAGSARTLNEPRTVVFDKILTVQTV